MNLNELSQQIHSAAKAKGFYETQRNTGEMLMLIVSELSEALEADRKNRYASMQHIDEFFEEGYTEKDSPHSFETLFVNDVKDTFEDEIADTIIRLLDLCGYRGIDIEKHIELKLKYNATRPNKHGKKY